MKVCIYLFVSLALGLAQKVTYDNYKVYKLVPSTDEQVQILIDLEKTKGVTYWSDIVTVNHAVQIMVEPEEQSNIVTYLNNVGLTPEVAIEDVQSLIDAQLIPSTKISRNSGSMDWNSYKTLDEIHDWLYELAEMYPEVVTVVTMNGLSNEGRQIKGVKIDFKPGQRGDSPLIGMIEGGIHAREWISPATVTWIINEFLTSNEEGVRSLAENFEWHLFPVVNPDGYVYTFTTSRLWRKNRNLAYNTTCTFVSDDISNGIDLNRNFDFVWMTMGASSDPCAETFAGPVAFSEPESRAIANYVQFLKQRGNLMYYIAFHSYTQLVLIPYSHVSGVNVLQAPNYADMYEIAIRGMDKLRARHGTMYNVGTSAEVLYEVTGSSFDWVKGTQDVPLVYLIELRDLGTYGFLLPTEQIIPNNEEIMEGLVEMHRVAKEMRYYSAASSVLASVLVVISGALFSLRSFL